MITLVAIFVVICCALVIFVRLSVNSLNSQLNDISYDVTRIKGVVSDIYTQQPYNSWFTDAYKGLNNKLDDINDHLTTEIACLATKNAEDIKRMNGDFKPWDVFEYKKEEFIIYHIERSTDGTVVYKCKSKIGYTTDFNKAEMACAKFLRTASPFEIKN